MSGLIWLVTRVGGWGEAWGGGPWRAGKGGDGEGAPESSVGATKGAPVPPVKPSNLTTGLLWLVTRVGGWGEAWGGSPWRAGKGGDGGESSVSNKRCTRSLDLDQDQPLARSKTWILAWKIATRSDEVLAENETGEDVRAKTAMKPHKSVQNEGFNMRCFIEL